MDVAEEFGELNEWEDKLDDFPAPRPSWCVGDAVAEDDPAVADVDMGRLLSCCW